MVTSLLANSGPALYPLPGSPPVEWAVWGGCLGLAALLGGWALRNMRRPARDMLVGVAVLAAFVLVVVATAVAVSGNHSRQMEQYERELQERAGPSP